MLVFGTVVPLGLAASDNNAPSFVEGSRTNRYAGEETAADGVFGAPIVATDSDEDAIRYTLGGGDASYFSIDSESGQLRTAATTTLEYETRNSYDVTVSASDGRGGIATIAVRIGVLDSVVTVPVQPSVRRRVRVTANESQIEEGKAVTFTFELLEQAPSGGVEIPFSLKQLAVDYGADTYDFRPLPRLNTHHHDSVSIAEGATTASVRYRTVADDYEETDAILVADIGLSSHDNFYGDSCNYEGSLEIMTISARPQGCWARVDVLDLGSLAPPEPVPFVRFASVFAGHVREFGGTNVQYIGPGDPIEFTISLNVPAPPGGMDVYYGLYEKSSDISSGILPYPNVDRRKVAIPAGETEVFLEIDTNQHDPIADDCEEEGHVGTACIRVTILSAPFIPVGDRHYLPYVHYPSPLRYYINTIIPRKVTITANKSPINEGDTAGFTITLSHPPPPDSPVTVALSLNQVGDFAKTLPLMRTVTHTTRMHAGVDQATLSLATVDDAVVEADGKIIARLQQTDAFMVCEPGEAEVVVLDNDSATVTIVALTSPIDEGETAAFEVRLSQAAPASGLAVQVALSQEGDFAASSLPELRTVQVGGGETTATVSVPTVNDTVVEDDGRIIALVRKADTYLVGEPGEAEVAVLDDDLATVTIVALASPIDEGETARFEVRLSPAAPTSGLAVQVALSQEGDFAASPLPELRAVQVGAGETTATVNVPTVDDAVTEDDGKILAAVQQAESYLVGEPGEAEVVVRDDDLATVTIVALTSPIDEGETAAFEVRLSQAAPASGLAVQVALSQEGDFATSPLPELRAVQVGAGERAAAVSVPTVDDAVTEDDGRILAAVQQADTYLVGEPGEAEVVVRDDDLATVTIVALATPIVEGETAAFEVRLSQTAPASGLAVQVALSQEGDFAASPLPDLRAVQVGAGERAATVSVPTVDDAVTEDDGKIIARVQQADTYLVGEPGEAEVVVLDDDLATVTIVALATPIVEGETAAFEVRLSRAASASGLAVQVALSQEGDFAASPLPELRAVQVGGGETTATVSVPTVDDAVTEDDGKIIARVQQAETYLVGTPGEAEVAVLDDDTATVTVIVTIVALATPIVEGEAAAFELRLSRAASASGMAVQVVLSQEGDFAATPLPELRAVQVGGGETTATVSVPTVDDAIVEDDGRILASVQQAETYLVGTPGEAEVAVLDDDLATVTIVALASPIYEGDTAEFEVRLSPPAPASGLAVQVALRQEGDFAASPLPELRAVQVGGGETTATVSVPTVDDAVVEDDGRILASVQQADTYLVGEPGEAEVAVLDDDLATVTIVALASPIDEGETAQFEVRLSPAAPASGLTVQVALSQKGDFATSPLPELRTVQVGGGEAAATLGVATVNDTVVEDDGRIIALVRKADTYLVGTPGEAEVAVLDDDLATVTIVALASPIYEGDTAQFEVRLSPPAPASGLAVQVALSQKGDFATSPLPELRTVQVGGGEAAVTLGVVTVNDTVVEDDGRIIALVRKADTYLVGEPGEAEVAVLDDDLATVTIVALASPIDEGETARFEVRLSPAAPSSGLAVEVALRQEGNFAASPLPKMGMVRVGAGEAAAMLDVATVDDEVVEDDGRIIAKVEQAATYLVGEPGEAEVAVLDDDLASGDDPTMEIIKEVVPRLGRTTAGIVAETIDCERYSRFRKDHVTIGGVDARLPSPGDHDSHATRYLEADAWHRDRLRDEFGMSTRQMLQSSSFELGSEDRDGGYGAAYWAEAAVAGFSGRVGSLSMTGSVLTGVGGMERLEDERRIGLAVARSRGDVTYNLPPVGSGEVRSSLTSVHPYLCWFWSDDSFAWGMVGAGWGEASLTGAVSVDSLKTSMRMFAGGGEWKLRSDEDHELVWKTSAFGVSTRTDEVGTLPTIQGNAVGFRSLIESAREHDLGSSALLRSSLQAGVRYDLGDAETGRGLLLGGGLRYVGPGEDRLLAEITGQTLARRTGSTFRDWSGTGLLRYSRGTGGRSLSLAFEAGRGLPGGAARRFLEAGVVPAESAGAPNSGGRAGLRLRYEMPVRYVRGNAAPSAGVTWRHDAPLLYSIGLNLSLKDGLELALGGAYQDAGQPESSVHLVLRVAW